jgi:hypothetical protein
LSGRPGRTVGEVRTEWNNPSAPVTVSIPYTPTAAELESPESIVVWYIGGRLSPTAAATRAQMAQMLYGLLSKLMSAE